MSLLSQHHLRNPNGNGSNFSSVTCMTGTNFRFTSTHLNLKWIIDTSATYHMTPHFEIFKHYLPLTTDAYITLPNGFKANIIHIGNIQLNSNLVLHNVLHVLEFHLNLLSVYKLAR